MAELESFQVFNSIHEEPKENNFASVNDITGSNQELINLTNNFDQNQESNVKNERLEKEKESLEKIESNVEKNETKIDSVKEPPFHQNEINEEGSNIIKQEGFEKTDSFVSGEQCGVEGGLPGFTATQNSINLIQQGNSFMPMQKLTPEQMAQVIAVVQQKNMEHNNYNLNNLDPNGHRMAYKIVLPGENMDKDLFSSYQLMQNPVDAYMHKKISTGATDVRMRLEKERKKKHRPRTRSGRISKPPKTVVKDYVRLHQLDYEEDYDDSDGGYSDYKMSSGEEEEERSKHSFKETSGLSSSSGKSKSFKCETCDKSYIGQAGLNRHYRLQPTHGKPDDEGGTEMGDSYYSSDSQSGIGHFKVQTTSTGSGQEAKKNEEGLTLSMEVDGGERSGEGSSEVVSRRGRRARTMNSNGGLYDGKKKQKLIEALKGCTDDDILDVFLSKCASSISIWKLLMTKTAKVYDSSIDSLISEVSNLNEQLSTYLNDKLVPFNEDEENSSAHANVFEMVDERMAQCLNIELGKYTVKVDEYLEGSVQAEEPTIYQTSPDMQGISLPLRKRLRMMGEDDDSYGVKDGNDYGDREGEFGDKDTDVDKRINEGMVSNSSSSNLLNAFSDLIKPSNQPQNDSRQLELQRQLQQLSQQQMLQKQLQQQQLQQLLSQQQQIQQQQQQQQISVTCYQLQEQIHVDENSLYVRLQNNSVVVKNADNSYQVYGELEHELTLDFLESLFANHPNN